MGMVLYELLTNQLPYPDVDSIGKKLVQRIQVDPTPLNETAPLVHPSIAGPNCRWRAEQFQQLSLPLPDERLRREHQNGTTT